MRIFLLSVVVAVVGAMAAEAIMVGYAQQGAESAYASRSARP